MKGDISRRDRFGGDDVKRPKAKRKMHKLCPFDGGWPRLNGSPHVGASKKPFWWVQCGKCGACQYGHASVKEAWATWDMRYEAPRG